MAAPNASLREHGQRALRDRNLPLAIQLLNSAATADDRDVEAKALLGIAYSESGMHAQANQCLRAAVACGPQNAGFRFQLGLALERAGDAAGAARSYREALQINPAFGTARARLQAIEMQGLAPPTGAPPPAAPSQPPPVAPAPPAALQQSPGREPAAPWVPSAPPPRPSPPAPGYSPPGPVPVPPPLAQGGYIHRPAPGYYPATVPYSAPPIDMDAADAFFRRLGARFIDGLVLSVVVYGTIILLIAIAAVLQPRGAAGGALGVALLLSIYVFPMVVVGVYHGLMDSRRGQTLGKMAVGLHIRTADGGLPSFWQAVLRATVGSMASSLLCFLGYFWMLWDPLQQTWADKIASTYVRRA